MKWPVLTAICATAIAFSADAAESPAVPEPAVAIEHGAFIQRATGQPFSPRGFNYIRLFPHRSHNTYAAVGRTGPGDFSVKQAAWIGTWAAMFPQNGFAGWLYWTYDTHEQSDQIWHARDGQDAIYRALGQTK